MSTQTLTADGSSAVPRELQGWNWGAFLLNVIWGLAHRCHFALLAFVPFFGLIVPFVLGAKGNAWAWRNGNWSSVAQFQETQRRWTRYALLAYAVAAAFCVALALGLMFLMKQSDVYKLATARLAQDARVAELLGTPIETGMVQGSVRTAGGSGQAEIDFSVSGPKATGRMYVIAEKRVGDWVFENLTLKLADGRRVELTARSLNVRALIGQTEVHGALSVEQVDAKLAEYVPQLSPCFVEVTSIEPVQALRLEIASDGSVENATSIGPNPGDAQVEACLSKLIQSWTFPKPSDGAGVVVRHGFVIQP